MNCFNQNGEGITSVFKTMYKQISIIWCMWFSRPKHNHTFAVLNVNLLSNILNRHKNDLKTQ